VPCDQLAQLWLHPTMAASGGIAYDANIANPPAKQGVGVMQQKLVQQRQLMRDRHRSARNRLGVSVVAQANPLAQPQVNRAQHWRSLSVDRPPSGGANRGITQPGSGHGRIIPSAGSGLGAAESKQQDADGGDSSLGNHMFERISMRPKSSLDDISDCAGVEEIFDVCVQGSVPEAEEPISPLCPPLDSEVQRYPHGFSPRRLHLAGTPGAVVGESPRVHASPRDRGASEAWGGAQGFQQTPSRQMGGDSVIESVSDFGNNRPPRGRMGDDQEVTPFSARKPRASWDLDVRVSDVRVSTPEGIGEPDANMSAGAPPEAGGRRGRRWRMFGKGSNGEQQQPASPSPVVAEPRRRPPLQPQQVQDEVAPFSMD
jgi:hypothetical protein